MNDQNPIDKVLGARLRAILEAFGRQAEAGEPPLASLPPSQRLAANAVLSPEEWITIHWGDMRFRENRSAGTKDPVNRSGDSAGKPAPFRPKPPRPRGKTLKELCDEHGMPELPADDPLYQTKYILYLPAPVPLPSPAGPGQVVPFPKLINRRSREPEDRKTWLKWLGLTVIALMGPEAALVPRTKNALSYARTEGLDWRDLYEAAKDMLGDRCRRPPDLELVDPERSR